MNQSIWNRLSGYLPEWDQQTWDRLFGYRHAFDERVVAVIVSILGTALVVAPLVIVILDRSGWLGPDLKDDLWRRYISWLVLMPLLVVPILLGAAWSLVVFTALSLLGFSGVRQGDRHLSRKADEPSGRDRYPVARIRRGGPLLSSFRRADSDEHRGDHGGGHLARPTQGISSARRTGDLRLPAVRNLPRPPFVHDQRHYTIVRLSCS